MVDALESRRLQILRSSYILQCNVFLSYVKKSPSLSLQSLLIASDGFFSQQEVQNTLNEQGRSTQHKVKFLSRAHQHGLCGFIRVPVLLFKSCVF